MSSVQSIERAFALLRALAVGPAGVTELAERTELPKSTVARLLGALLSEGAVQRVEAGGDYRLGGDLLELAMAASPDRSLIATARPFLAELTEATGETSGIAVLEEAEVRYLDNVEIEEEVQVRDWTGEAVPFNLVPSGLVMVAALEPDEIDRHLRGPLTRTTDASISEPDDLRRRLGEIKRTGHAWVYGEFDTDLNSVAAPVVDARGVAMAAIHIHGPAYRFPEPKQAREIGVLVSETAQRLSSRLT